MLSLDINIFLILCMSLKLLFFIYVKHSVGRDLLGDLNLF